MIRSEHQKYLSPRGSPVRESSVHKLLDHVQGHEGRLSPRAVVVCPIRTCCQACGYSPRPVLQTGSWELCGDDLSGFLSPARADAAWVLNAMDEHEQGLAEASYRITSRVRYRLH